LRFRYVQADLAGNLDAGMSDSMLVRLADGRMRMVENFEWSSRTGEGRNVFEEVGDDGPELAQTK
jgi:hypothetical protein